jgi:hypothetical protein
MFLVNQDDKAHGIRTLGGMISGHSSSEARAEPYTLSIARVLCLL